MPRVFWLAWAGMLVNKLGTFVVPFLALYLTQVRHYSMERTGLICSLQGAGALLSAGIGGVFADRLGRRLTLSLSLGLGAVELAHLAIAGSQIGRAHV